MVGCSHQKDENSVRDVDERMKGGAVKDDKSPENEAMDLRKALQEPLFCADTPAPSFSFEDIVVGRWVSLKGVESLGVADCCWLQMVGLVAWWGMLWGSLFAALQ